MRDLNFFEIYFVFFFLLTFAYTNGLRYLRKGLKKHNGPFRTDLPLVTIVVSMHNEEHNVHGCLDALVHLDYPVEKLEIIIVDDRSKDRTPRIIAEFSSKYDFIKTMTIDELNEGFAPKKYAIDSAVRSACGEIILLTDADGRPQPGWVRQMVSFFTEETGMVIGYAPYSDPPPKNGFFNRLLSLEYLSHAAVAAATSGLGYPVTCVGTNMAYRKSVFLQLDGFGKFKNIHTGDDDLFLQRVREETNWQIAYCTRQQSHVYNPPPDNIKKFFHQRLRYASKGLLYPWKISAVLSLFYMLELITLLTPLTFLIVPGFVLPWLAIVILKAVGEYLFFSKAATFLEDTRQLSLFPVAFLLHIPYVVVFGALGQIVRFEWGSRKS
ncbi:MAG: glycosyltransferase [Calditrichales bacterium]|nr:MAG: glycosyltransferase [Calditrichales bacterium]